jgi:hypothetical protein
VGQTHAVLAWQARQEVGGIKGKTVAPVQLLFAVTTAYLSATVVSLLPSCCSCRNSTPSEGSNCVAVTYTRVWIILPWGLRNHCSSWLWLLMLGGCEHETEACAAWGLTQQHVDSPDRCRRPAPTLCSCLQLTTKPGKHASAPRLVGSDAIRTVGDADIC